MAEHELKRLPYDSPPTLKPGDVALPTIPQINSAIDTMATPGEKNAKTLSPCEECGSSRNYVIMPAFEVWIGCTQIALGSYGATYMQCLDCGHKAKPTGDAAVRHPHSNRYWLSWQETNPETFCYDGPWWVSGESDDGLLSMCAAVVAPSEEAAKKVIAEAHDDKREPDNWRFCNPRPDDWSPFSERFPRAYWMRWP